MKAMIIGGGKVGSTAAGWQLLMNTIADIKSNPSRERKPDLNSGFRL